MRTDKQGHSSGSLAKVPETSVIVILAFALASLVTGLRTFGQRQEQLVFLLREARAGLDVLPWMLGRMGWDLVLQVRARASSPGQGAGQGRGAGARGHTGQGMATQAGAGLWAGQGRAGAGRDGVWHGAHACMHAAAAARLQVGLTCGLVA